MCRVRASPRLKRTPTHIEPARLLCYCYFFLSGHDFCYLKKPKNRTILPTFRTIKNLHISFIFSNFAHRERVRATLRSDSERISKAKAQGGLPHFGMSAFFVEDTFINKPIITALKPLKLITTMQKVEFETLTDKSVSDAEYSFIERVYMAVEGMNKQVFCDAWKKGDLSFIVAVLVEEVEQLRKRYSDYRSRFDANSIALKIDDFSQLYDDFKLKDMAISLIGIDLITAYDLDKGYRLKSSQRAFLADILRSKIEG